MAKPINMSVFDAAKLSFTDVKKLDKGGSFNILYDGNPLILKSRPLKAPFAVSKGFNGGKKGGEAKPKDDGEREKYQLQLDLVNNDDNKSLINILAAVDAAILNHITKNAAVIYGESGLALKPKDLADVLKSVGAGTMKMYPLIKASDNQAYPAKISLKWLPTQVVTIVNKKNRSITVDEITRNSLVTAVFKIRGVFISSLMVASQTDPIALCVAGGEVIDTLDLFAGDLDDDAVKDDHSDASSQGAAKKMKMADPELSA